MERKLGRGDIVWVDFTSGHEQSGRRPALVVSPSEYNERSGLLLACPITSKSKGYPFEVNVKGKVAGVILADQLRSIDWKARKAVYVETVPAATLNKVKVLIGLLVG